MFTTWGCNLVGPKEISKCTSAHNRQEDKYPWIIPLYVTRKDGRVHHPFVLTTAENLRIEEIDLTSPLLIAHKSKGNIIQEKNQELFM